MPSIILECPHCGAEKIGFNIVYDRIAILPQVQPPARFVRSTLVCAGCDEMVVGSFHLPMGVRATENPAGLHVDPQQLGWILANVYPSPSPSKCPEHTPDNLKRIFVQAANALKRGDPDASGAMSWKVVDVSTQTLLGEKSKDYVNIYQRIEALAAKGALTSDLKDWAHAVRLGGADAAHDLDPFTQEEADELLDFAELYLIYVYSLPGRLTERRARAEAEKAKKPPAG